MVNENNYRDTQTECENESHDKFVKCKQRINALKELLGNDPEYDFEKSGTRIEMSMEPEDPYTNLKRGSKGTIELIKRNDGIEDQIWVNWDNGAMLMLLVGKDEYVEIGFIGK